MEIPPPDPVWQTKPKNECPIVIDLGSYETRAGWASEHSPFLSFRTMVGRGKVDGELRDIVGNDLEHLSIPNKSPFNLDVPYHFTSIEAITDHIFGHLGLSGQSSIAHPVVITEPVCNPRHTRICMTEMMFECYGVPKLTFGIDALFSYWYHYRDNIDYLLSSSGLVLRSGYKTTHILPVVNGLLSPQILRINLGGHQCTTLLQQLLHLSYPYHSGAISYNVAEYLKEKYCYVARDYIYEMNVWQKILQGNDMQRENTEIPKITVVHLPNNSQKPTEVQQHESKTQTMSISPGVSAVSSSAGGAAVPSVVDKKDQVREERIMRMRQMVQKRKDQKIKEKQDIVNYVERLFNLKEEDPILYDSTLENEGQTEKELKQELQKAKKYLNDKQDPKGKSKGNGKSQQKEAPPDYSLLNVSDDKLDENQKKEKKKQKFLKNMADARELKKREREAKEAQDRGEEERLEDEIKADPEKWLTKIQQQRTELQHRIEQKRRLSVSRLHGRQTVQSIARMKALTEVDADHEIEDWNIYLQLSGDVISEGREEEKLNKLTALLHQYFPEQLQTQDMSFTNESSSMCRKLYPTPKSAQEHELSLSTCKCRVGEVVFQPFSIIGLQQMGLIEATQLTLQTLYNDASNLVANVFTTGGNFGYYGVKERLERELLEIMPVGTNINVAVATDPVLDTWRGAANFANSPHFQKSAFTKKQYFECGIDYVLEKKRHFSLFP